MAHTPNTSLTAGRHPASGGELPATLLPYFQAPKRPGQADDQLSLEIDKPLPALLTAAPAARHPTGPSRIRRCRRSSKQLLTPSIKEGEDWKPCRFYPLNVAIASLVIATVAIVVAGASAAYTRKQATEQAKVAAIERDRRHDELAPIFAITCTVKKTAHDWADLRVTFTDGPEHLDEVVISILDETDKDHWRYGLPDGVTQEQAQAFVWGPWEFNTHASAQVVSNRESRSRPYSRVSGKNWDLLSLTPTRPGHWMTGTSQDVWRKQYRDHPIRLLITSRRKGYEPWFVQRDVKIEYPKVARIRPID